jgi:hypothetical protein
MSSVQIGSRAGVSIEDFVLLIQLLPWTRFVRASYLCAWQSSSNPTCLQLFDLFMRYLPHETNSISRSENSQPTLLILRDYHRRPETRSVVPQINPTNPINPRQMFIVCKYHSIFIESVTLKSRYGNIKKRVPVLYHVSLLDVPMIKIWR